MAITKILARKGRLDTGINYILNGDKTEGKVLTAHLNCDPGRECREMLDTKRNYGKEDGVQYYHIIQSFKPGEITPELALEVAKEFAQEHLPRYETVIGVHVDKQHIHAHILFNSVNADTGQKYHSNARNYYQQIRAVSDRLCREHGLSVIMQSEPTQAVSYIEWLRQSKGQPTFRSMLEADLRTAIEDANDLGHFFLLMEHMGWEISHGSRLGFRLRGQERFMIPGRKNPLFTEEGIQAAIQGNLSAIDTGHRPATIYRPPYRPFKKYPKYTGFMALYVHYLYVLGKIEKRQYPPRMMPQLRKEVMRFERYREQFVFLRENDIVSQEDMAAFQSRTEDALANLMKQRTILNVRKKKRKKLYDALADVDVLAQAKELYEDGLSGMETEYTRYLDAAAVLEQCPIPRERVTTEKAEVYEHLAQINRDIRSARKKLALTLALAKNNKTLSGKVNLGKMLRETRDLRQFPMTPEQYKRFAKLAKKQKILFSAIRDKDDHGKLIDVILPVTELDRANMIFEKLAYVPSVQQDRPPERSASQREQERPQVPQQEQDRVAGP